MVFSQLLLLILIGERYDDDRTNKLASPANGDTPRVPRDTRPGGPDGGALFLIRNNFNRHFLNLLQ